MCSNQPKLMKMTPSPFWNPSKDSKEAEQLVAPLGAVSTANMVEAPSPHLQLLRRAS